MIQLSWICLENHSTFSFLIPSCLSVCLSLLIPVLRFQPFASLDLLSSCCPLSAHPPHLIDVCRVVLFLLFLVLHPAPPQDSPPVDSRCCVCYTCTPLRPSLPPLPDSQVLISSPACTRVASYLPSVFCPTSSFSPPLLLHWCC